MIWTDSSIGAREQFVNFSLEDNYETHSVENELHVGFCVCRNTGGRSGNRGQTIAGWRRWRQKNKHENRKDEQRGGDDKSRDRAESKVRKSEYFDDHRRTVIHNYYREQFRSGRCPPGLAKKRNGCMPPGQAKKWAFGRPLPRDVIYYDVPSALIVQIGQPPAGHRYVRVATDILLIAIGTGMVVDAIEDLGGM